MILKTLATLALVGTLAVALQLPGCSGGGISVAQVVADAKAVCAFEPTAATVVGVISANPTVTQATGIAAAICAAVASVPATAGAGVPSNTDKQWAVITTNGKTVPVVGHFVVAVK